MRVLILPYKTLVGFNICINCFTFPPVFESTSSDDRTMLQTPLYMTFSSKFFGIMTEVPPAPTFLPHNVFTTKVILNWVDFNSSATSRDPEVVKKIVNDWAGTHGEDDQVAIVEAAFGKYDTDGTGQIDAIKLTSLLVDLGIEVTDAIVREIFEEYDTVGSGSLGFQDFARWWRRSEVKYLITRSLEMAPLEKKLLAQSASQATLKKTRSKKVIVPSDVIKSCPTLPPFGFGRSASGRFFSAGRTGTKAVPPPPTDALGKTKRNVPVTIVSYEGYQPQCEITGLEPNRLYHFKLQYQGSRCSSVLGPALPLMTAPLPPPLAPLLMHVTLTKVKLKWYPPAFGAFKFVVQVRAVIEGGEEGYCRQGNALSTAEKRREKWKTVLTGLDTFWNGTGLLPHTKYQARVLSVNCQGICSEPSPVLKFSTLEGTAVPITPSTKASFKIQCTGDICVGDTILMTERLFAKPLRAKESKDSKSGATDSVDASKVNSTKVFIGERVIAALVVKDDFRLARDILASADRPVDSSTVSAADVKKIGKVRKLWLEVLWHRSDPACRPYELQQVLERFQADVEKFDVFRCPWDKEDLRMTLWQEWAALSECYVQLNC